MESAQIVGVLNTTDIATTGGCIGSVKTAGSRVAIKTHE